MNRRDFCVSLVIVFCLMLVAGCAGTPQAAPPTQMPVPPTSTPRPTPLPSATAESQSGDVPEVLAALQAAINGQDLDALMSLFVAESPRFVETGFADVAGTSLLRSYWDMQFGLGAVFKGLKNCALRGEVWQCTLVARDDCYGVYGLEESESEFSARLKDGKIVSINLTPSADTAKLAKEKLNKFYAWVQTNRPDDWRTLNSQVMSRAVGETYSRLCKEYAATQK